MVYIGSDDNHIYSFKNTVVDILTGSSISSTDTTPTINITTSENATCRGSVGLDENYSDMNFNFTSDYEGTTHNYTFESALSAGSNYIVYTRCVDNDNFETMESFILNIKINNPIFLSGSSSPSGGGDRIINANNTSIISQNKTSKKNK